MNKMNTYLLLAIIFQALAAWSFSKSRSESRRVDKKEILKGQGDQADDLKKHIDSTQKETVSQVSEKIKDESKEVKEEFTTGVNAVVARIDKSDIARNTLMDEVKDGIKEVKNAVKDDNLNANKKEDFEIVEFKNNSDLFSITVINNSSDSKFIKKVVLNLSDRQPLEYLISPMNTYPHSNEEILINLLPNKDKYNISPNIYIEPKKAEILNFRLHRPHEYLGYEIMKMNFDLHIHDGNVYSTEVLLDQIGHYNMVLVVKEEYQEENKTKILKIIDKNKSIIESAGKSTIKKSNRLMGFLGEYNGEVEEALKVFNK